MKKTTPIFFSVVAALLILSVAVYAHESLESERENGRGMFSMMGGMMGFEGMDKMHEEMTSGLDPELKSQMDEMHEGCINSFSKNKNSYQMMG